MEGLTERQARVLDLRVEKGYSIANICEELDITRKIFQDEVDVLREKGLYDEAKIKRRMHARKYKSEELPPEEKRYWKMAIDFFVKQYLGYDETKYFNTLVPMKFKELHKTYSYKIIFFTIKDQHKNLKWACEKVQGFSNDYNKIAYLMTIIKNNLNHIYLKTNERERFNQGQLNKYSDKDLVGELNKKRTTKRTKRTDLSQFID